MKTTQPLLWNKWMRNGRKPARPPHRFTECKKLELKDSVSSSSKQAAELACNAQMMDMMACLKDNDFNQAKCEPHITAFKNCYNANMEKVTRSRHVTNRDEPVPGQTKLSMFQVNALLKRFPQPK